MLQEYFKDTLEVALEIEETGVLNSLPFFINDSYRFWRITLFNKTMIGMQPISDEKFTPAKLKNHTELVRNNLHQEVIVLELEMSAYNRQRLIVYKVPFIVPGNQMYLPELMIDLRDHFKAIRATSKYLSPSAQVVLIYIINNRINGTLTPGKLAEELKYSNMTLTRAFDEIEAFELLESVTSGKERLLVMNKRREDLWQQALQYMKSPIKNKQFVRIFNRQWERFRISGLSALSRYTIISPQSLEELAISKNDFHDGVDKRHFEKVHFKEEADAHLEVWNYSPRLNIEDKSLVDKYSLYLSLIGNKDERVEKALEDLKKEFVW